MFYNTCNPALFPSCLNPLFIHLIFYLNIANPSLWKHFVFPCSVRSVGLCAKMLLPSSLVIATFTAMWHWLTLPFPLSDTTASFWPRYYLIHPCSTLPPDSLTSLPHKVTSTPCMHDRCCLQNALKPSMCIMDVRHLSSVNSGTLSLIF